MNRFYLICMSLLFVLSASLVLTGEAASNLPSGLENPLTIRYPQLAQAAAPDWLVEGTRATYYVISGTADSEQDRAVEYGSGNAGYGLSQTDIVALEDGLAAANTQTYVPDSFGAFRPVLGTASVSPLGCGDFWCNPNVLNRIPESAADDLTVQKLPLTISGKSYRTIRFDFTDDTLQMAMVYDLDSGILLYHTVDYSSYSNRNNYLSTNSNHATYEFRDLRTVQMPWKRGALPSWLAAHDTLTYQGQTAVQVQGAQPYGFPRTIQGVVTALHNRYAEMTFTTYANDAVATTSSTTSVGGINQLLGFWIPEDAVGTLGTGIVDSDPDTGMVISIMQSGADGMIFEKTNRQDYRTLFAYDSDGRLVQMTTELNPDSTYGSSRTETLQLIG
jgi:hypothetical protein